MATGFVGVVTRRLEEHPSLMIVPLPRSAVLSRPLVEIVMLPLFFIDGVRFDRARVGDQRISGSAGLCRCNRGHRRHRR